MKRAQNASGEQSLKVTKGNSPSSRLSIVVYKAIYSWSLSVGPSVSPRDKASGQWSGMRRPPVLTTFLKGNVKLRQLQWRCSILRY